MVRLYSAAYNLFVRVRPAVAALCFLLAASTPAQAADNTIKSSLAWGIIVLLGILGVAVTVLPAKREKEVKGRKE